MWWFWLIFNKQSQQIRIWWHANQLINSKHLQTFAEPSKWSLSWSLGYTITGKTADLTVVQKTIIDTLHKEGKTQTLIAKEAGCSQSAVSKHVNRELSGRKKVWKKKMHNHRENRSLVRIVKQNKFKNLGELHKEWTEAGVKASRAPHTDVSRNLASVVIRSILPGLRKKNWTVTQWSKVLFSDESKFCISFGNQGPRVWRKCGEAYSPSCLKSSVKFPQSVMIWGAMSSAGVGPLLFLFLNQHHCTRFTITFWSTSCFLLLASFLKMLISFSSRIWHLPTHPKAPEVG